MKKLGIGLSVVLNVLVVALLVWFFAGGFGYVVATYFIQPNRERMVSLWEEFPVERGHVLFLGDSITQGGRWSEFFPELEVKNLGIGGDTTKDVLARLDQVTRGQPDQVFLMIGTNDLGFGYPADATGARYAEILFRLARDAPQTRVYVQSVLPRGADYEPLVLDLNQRIRGLARERRLPYIDLYPAFVCDDGSICDELSNDELHLLGPGYATWVEQLRPYLIR